MFKRYLFTFITLLFISNLKAQDVRFGLKGGVNFAKASQGDIDNQSVTSFHIGGVMEALYANKIALQPEIIYSEQGFNYTEANMERALKLSYINVPVMLKYYPWQELFIEAGPQIGFLNTARLTTTTEGIVKTRSIKEGLRSNDLSLNLGFGFQLKNGWNINARYCYGLTNITDRLTDDKFKNRVIQVSLGYFF